MGRSGLVLVVLVLAFGLTGVAFAGVTHLSVTVTVTDTTLGISPAGLQAGIATFVVVNGGQKPHALAIVGPGLRNVHTPKLATGKRATLTVTLRTGAYVLSDPFSTSNSHWLVVGPASVVRSSGKSSTGTGSSFTETGMNCD
jgi:hypothetical protein